MQLHRFRFVPTLALILASTAARGGESRLPFHGPYVAVDVSRQNTIAGALVAGVDTLAQASRGVASLSGGYRHQFGGGVVLGVEGGFGVTDGDLRLSDPNSGLAVAYRNGSQYFVGGSVGLALGADRRTLAFAYVSETKRSFEVTLRGPLGVGMQNDKQGLLRYGLGVERRLTERLSIRTSVGSSRADFGNRRTNMKPNTRIDASLGALWQF